MSANSPHIRDGDIRFTLRLLITLPEELKEIVRAETRSVEKQLVFILKQWAKGHGRI